MDKDSKLKYLNDSLNNPEANKDSHPKSLFKYRPFDKYAMDMLENDYVYLCPAGNEDDETECYTYVRERDINDFINNKFDMKSVIDEICKYLKAFGDEDKIKLIGNMLCQSINCRGEIDKRILLEVTTDLQYRGLITSEESTAIGNSLANFQDTFMNEEVKIQLEELLSRGYYSKKRIGICSLSEISDSEEMWQKYADNDRGYCIEYSFENYININSLFPVIYDNNRDPDLIKSIVFSLLGNLINRFSNGNINADTSQYLRMFLTKYKKREYQKEWRIIDDADIRTKSPKIKTIILGKKIDINNENKLRDFASKHNIEIIKR